MSLPRVLSLLAAVVLLLLAGCGGDSDSVETDVDLNGSYGELWLDLDGLPGPENAGPVVAERDGYFEEVGLGPWIGVPIEPERTTKYVDEDVADASLAMVPQVVQARAEGRPLVIVGSVLPEATMAMIWPAGSGIDGVADLKGKTIAYPGVHFQKDFLEYILKGAGLTLADVKLKDVGFGLVDALDSGRADAIFGGSGNEEGVLLEKRGLDPVVTKATDLGIPDYDELVLIVRRDNYAKYPGIFERMLDASIRGNVKAGEDPKAADKALFELERSLQRAPLKPNLAGIEATAPLLSTTGELDEQRLEGLVDWMYEQGMIKRKLPLSALLARP